MSTLKMAASKKSRRRYVSKKFASFSARGRLGKLAQMFNFAPVDRVSR